MAVPLLDLTRQYQKLKPEIDAAVLAVLGHNKFIMGPEVKAFEDAVTGMLGVKHAIGVASGSDALILALHAVGVEAGDEVIVPSFTFFASAGSVTRLNGRPVFCDIRREDYNIDPNDVEKRITPRTKAIMPVHLFGQMADMKALRSIADPRRIPLVEDAAQSISATFDGVTAGKWGTVGCFSFFPSKNLGGAGDGGMIVSDHDAVADRARLLRVHGAKPKYYHKLVGFNSRLDTIQAAILSVKLKHLNAWSEARRRHADVYDRELAGVGDLELPRRTKGTGHIFNQYTIATAKRDALRDHLKAKNIGMEIYYPVPLHLQECYAHLGYRKGDFPVSEMMADRVLSIPIFPELTETEQAEVIDAIKQFFA